MQKRALLVKLSLVLVSATFWGAPGFPQAPFINWETPHVHPLDLTPSGDTLLAVNTADNRLEVFSITTATAIHMESIPVGLDPVTVRARTDLEVWVVNHISDTISIVDLAIGNVVRTLPTEDEPADVVFAGTPERAFVSCSQANSILVFDPSSLDGPPDRIAIEGEDPRAMAVSSTGSEVYVAIFESGNNTTILGGGLADLGVLTFPPNVVNHPLGPYNGQNPPPNDGSNFTPLTNPANPPPPAVGLIVKKVNGSWLDDNGGDWTSLVSGNRAEESGRQEGWELHDHDLGIINTTDLSVSYVTGLMNLCMALAVHPDTAEVSVVGTDATNDIRYEPNLKGRFLRVNLAVVDPASPESSSVVDLNPHLDYLVSTIPQESRDSSLGDPRGIVWHSSGASGYVSGMGSSNVAVVDAAGARVGGSPIEVGSGPTGLALDEPRERLYVLNKFDGSLSVIDITTENEVTRVPFFDPTPVSIKVGRKHLYDTHKNSGLGHTACGSCHIDARMDRLAWDLGDPAGEMKSFNQNCFTAIGIGCQDWHPMKGPMTTQTLQDIIGKEPHHWRADRDGIEEFNHAFIGLQGDDDNLSALEMQEFESFLATIHFPPNPFRNFDNSLPQDLPLPGHFTTGRFAPGGQPLPNGNATTGLSLYREDSLDGIFQCVTCHTLPTGLGMDLALASVNPVALGPIPEGPNGEHHVAVFSLDGSTNISIKIPQLRNLYDKVGFDTTQLSNGAGFGFLHDGSVDSIARFIAEPAFSVTSDQDIADLVAFMLAFSGSDLPQGSADNIAEPPGLASQDTHAAVGVQLTIDALNREDAATIDLLVDMIALADAGAVGIVAKGRQAGQGRGYTYTGNGLFQSDRATEVLSSTALRLAANAGAEMTFTVVPTGTETRIGIDRDEDGFLDRDELDACSNPANPQLTPENSSCEAQFTRGKCNDDSEVDLSDAVFLLLWLFQEGSAPLCADACDFNDDGTLDLSDPIAELGFLFHDATVPPLPFGDCGGDPTEDLLRCEVFSNCP